MENEKKSIFASKTFYANIIAGAVTLGGVFGLDLGLDAEAQSSLVTGIFVVVNIIMRLITKGPASITGS